MAAISVTTTPVQVTSNWIDIRVDPASAQPVYYDSVNTVSSTTGVKIDIGGVKTKDIRGEAGLIWLVTATGTADVRVYADAYL